ncbi:MAG: YIP1 family protein [Candidatus Aenigmatarchaeota archaeon]
MKAIEKALYLAAFNLYLVRMCLDVFRHPVNALAAAKKSRNMNSTIKTLLCVSALFGIAAALITYKIFPIPPVAAMAGIGIFVFSLVCMLFSGLVIQIISNTLGGKGEYYEGLTAITYSHAPISLGVLITSIFLFVPIIGIAIGIIAISLSLAYGISMLYRGIKELFKTDMIVSFVAVSVFIIVMILTMYVFVLLNLSSFADMSGMMGGMKWAGI